MDHRSKGNNCANGGKVAATFNRHDLCMANENSWNPFVRFLNSPFFRRTIVYRTNSIISEESKGGRFYTFDKMREEGRKEERKKGGRIIPCYVRDMQEP